MSFWKSPVATRWVADQDRLNPKCVAAFEAALANGGFGPGTYNAWNAYVNRDVLAIFEGEDWLSIGDAVRLYAEKTARQREFYPDAYWRKAGNFLHYALALGLIAEAQDPERGRGFRIVHQLPHWIVDGAGCKKFARQVRGLPPAEQAAEDKRQARLAKLAATLDRKARFAADDGIAESVREILRNDPLSLVPEKWAARGSVPTWLVNTRLDAGAAVVRDAHHAREMTRVMLRHWLGDLRTEAALALMRSARRRVEAFMLPEHAVIPAEDEAALGALA